jgi:hypothetical protein
MLLGDAIDTVAGVSRLDGCSRNRRRLKTGNPFARAGVGSRVDDWMLLGDAVDAVTGVSCLHSAGGNG